MVSGLSVVSGSVGESSAASPVAFQKQTRNPAVHYNSALSQYQDGIKPARRNSNIGSHKSSVSDKQSLKSENKGSSKHVKVIKNQRVPREGRES